MAIKRYKMAINRISNIIVNGFDSVFLSKFVLDNMVETLELDYKIIIDIFGKVKVDTNLYISETACKLMHMLYDDLRLDTKKLLKEYSGNVELYGTEKYKEIIKNTISEMKLSETSLKLELSYRD